MDDDIIDLNGSFSGDGDSSDIFRDSQQLYEDSADSDDNFNNSYDMLADPAFWDFVQQYQEYNDLGIDLMSLSPSAASYLSTTQLDLFDRIIAGGSYRYYIGYRTGSDSYSAVLYACNEVTVNGSVISLVEPMQFQLYRTYSGNTYYYYYTHSQLQSDSVTLNNNILYYTNIVSGYPTLASLGDNDLQFSKTQIYVFGIFAILILLLLMRRKRNSV